MERNKIDFIADLLADKRINTAFKERAFELAGREIQNVLNIENENNLRISKIENIINSINTPTSLINEHSTTKFLRLFDSDLKFLTHKWENTEEEGFNFNEYRISLKKKAQEKINSNDYVEWVTKEDGKSKAPPIYKVPEALWHRVNSFIDKRSNKKENKAEWFAHHIFGKTVESFYSWDNQKFLEWFDNATSKSITSPLIDKEMILPFKNSIQIRTNDLRKHIEPLVQAKLGTEYKVDYVGLDAAKFYTDVQGLMSGVISILEQSIKPWAEEEDLYVVTFEYEEQQNKKVLKIIHQESKCKLNTTNSDLIGGSMKAIREKFNRICNWSIEASFADGNKRINLLSDAKDLSYIENLESEPLGFTHIMTFY
jgi:hypothetical protein